MPNSTLTAQLVSAMLLMFQSPLNVVANQEPDVASVRKFFDDWVKAERNADIAALADSVSEDCVFLLPGQAPRKGREEVRRLYEQFFSAYRDSEVEHHVSIEDAKVVGAYAFFWGVDELTITTGGHSVKARGYGLGVLKRVGDGRWKSYLAMNNMARAAE